MEDNARRIAAGQSDVSSCEHNSGRIFSLWDALDLALEESRPPDMLKSLIDSFSRLDDETELDALHILGEMGRRLPDGPKRGVIAYLLAKYLDDSRVEVRVASVQAVGMLSRRVLAEALAWKLVNDKSARVRIASAEALGELTVSVTLHTLKESLNDPSWEVRAAAIQSLGSLGEQLIIEPLKMALKDQDFSVRSAALHALGIFKGCLSTQYLVSLAQEETNDWITRDAAVTVLERVGEYTLAQPLRERLNGELEAESDLNEEEIEVAEVSEQALVPPNLAGAETPPVANEQAELMENEKTKIHTQGRQVQEGMSSSSHEIKEAGNKADSNSCHKPTHERDEHEQGRTFPFPILGKRVKEKKRPLRWLRHGEKVACISHYLRKYGAVLFFRSKGGVIAVFCALFLLVGGSIMRSYASVSHHLKKYGAVLFFRSKGEAIVALWMLFLLVGGFVLRSYASDALTARASSPFSVASLPTPTLIVVPQQQDDAHLVVVSQLGSMIPGQQFSVSITAINTGSTAWTDTGGYQLICRTGAYREVNCMGMHGMIISHPVHLLGGTYTFVVTLIAPHTAGTYKVGWAMSHNGIPFGDNPYITVHVSEDTNTLSDLVFIGGVHLHH